MRRMSTIARLIALAVLLLPVSLPALAMGPGMILVQDVPPGREVDLHKLGGARFTVYNRSDAPQDYSLACKRPILGGLAAWERGYEEIPDPAWCRLEETVITVPAHGQKEVGLIIALPDRPELLNRRFMLAVVLTGGKQAGTSVGLAVASRVQIETTVDDRLSASVGGPLAVAPANLRLIGRPGEQVHGTVLVRNNTPGRIETTLQRLAEVYPEMEKHARYLTAGTLAVSEPWLTASSATVAVEAGAGSLLHFNGSIPAGAEPGRTHEQLAFLCGKGADGSEICSLIRLHCQVLDAVAVPGTAPR
jgi:hypothetical protein